MCYIHRKFLWCYFCDHGASAETKGENQDLYLGMLLYQPIRSASLRPPRCIYQISHRYLRILFSWLLAVYCNCRYTQPAGFVRPASFTVCQCHSCKNWIQEQMFFYFKKAYNLKSIAVVRRSQANKEIQRQKWENIQKVLGSDQTQRQNARKSSCTV